MPVWLAALLGVPALLAAAKAHGREIRLEREAAGYHSVQFGGSNPEFVERLWARDRRRFWTTAPLAALALGLAAWLAASSWSLTLVAAFLWGPIVAFHVAGLRVLAARGAAGGVAWWALAAGLTLASVGAALL